MSTKNLSKHLTTHPTHGHDDAGANKVFGFWIYLMSDCIMFAALFATYAVLHNSVAGGVKGKEIFELSFVLGETFLLLFSSMTYSIAILSMRIDKKTRCNIWLGLTFLLGLSFICMELYEFYNLMRAGHGPDRSAFLSSFFTLVGTHGLHVTAGLIWILIMIHQISRNGLTHPNKIRLQCLSLFWHFLDVVWICVFTVVYLMGAL
ncbi:cytochrome o ubiquinol oxidase subunit III [secondary endosymbiont of Ctenarytaina eucalypti]|uniref:Cytochrome bo(3) ubiquinol oxidase subunit 3 n=1 Tax=secondary endosymbiont of Ctenarytaina eucalypti TaxID=1199245 RepID=J3VTG5_9ENTR|nr:cytochrome o ubiquinol oxidase subunit III [secondary endosymbiont of Ctenarytaina eucalypti]AFP85266.1 cytochrome o ubiquinol oxidase, subunit III [secondary endosymbiont of Ctenarytaina eucalypti]